MRCDWSLPMIYWSTETWMISQETCLLCFVEHGTRFWKCFWDYFGLREVKASKKRSKSYLQRKMDKRREKELFTNSECLNYKKSSQQLPLCVIATRDSLFFANILLWARKDVETLFEETVYKKDKEKKQKQRRNIVFGTSFSFLIIV